MSNSEFASRHIGPDDKDLTIMLKEIGLRSIDQLIDETIPASIQLKKDLRLPEPLSEYNYLKALRKTASLNKIYNSYIGLGYYNCITPGVILRNIFENPGWYTAYTPYQAEISQGRLEALLNYQTMILDLSGMEITNASLIVEATAAAEAMHMFFAFRPKEKQNALKFFVANDCFPQTIDVLKTRSAPLGIELVINDPDKTDLDETFFGALLQYPSCNGEVRDYKNWISKSRSIGIQIAVASDLMALVMLTPPGEFGADVVLGNTQRFGVPLGYGGPHAAFFAAKEIYKREMPGRIIGVSQDSHGNRALRMALQTREQHIRRDKATSNICTAQVLLAVMAGMYAVYHGQEGLKKIAGSIHENALKLAEAAQVLGFTQINKTFFDTLLLEAGEKLEAVKKIALQKKVNFRYVDTHSFAISVDETTGEEELQTIISILTEASSGSKKTAADKQTKKISATTFSRTTPFLTHPVFNTHHSETEMLRYITQLEGKDLSLNHSMIALGSCTMKLNATSELIPLSWPEWSSIHPFVPLDQAEGYHQIITELENYLKEITGFDAVSLQPNSGAQGEYAGLMVIRAYHLSRGDKQRDTVLIPSSAHGTNPASAVMAGMKVVVVKCDDHGNIEISDLRNKAENYKASLAGLMVTYPSTHGVFEEGIKEITKIIHDNGGQVYMDGANMNAQVGLTNPATIGADVCHLNLHKTFAIPHGGGGPGMGPIGVASHLTPFLPSHPLVKTGGSTTAVSAAPWGSSSILLISYAYIKMLGPSGLVDSTKFAILNANYIKAKLESHYNILYVGSKNRVAHEMIIDCRPFKQSAGIEVEDIAKRLMDYGFHAPTMSFPVAGTMMIEPTESETREELDRFCDTMIQIRKEIEEIEKGQANKTDNVLKNAPHTMLEVTGDSWTHAYSRKKAAFPLHFITQHKFWPSVGRVDNAYGDRNLICSCPSIESYVEETV